MKNKKTVYLVKDDNPSPNPPDGKPVLYDGEYMTKEEFLKRTKAEGKKAFVIEVVEDDDDLH